MSPVGDRYTSCEFSDKIPPWFDGHSDYGTYRDDVKLWMNFTILPALKHRPVIVGRLLGEAKSAAKTLSTETICKYGGMDVILERLERAYAVDKKPIGCRSGRFFRLVFEKRS